MSKAALLDAILLLIVDFSRLPLVASIFGFARCQQDCINENQRSKFKDPFSIVNTRALARTTPSFYISDRDIERIQGRIEKGGIQNLPLGFQDHPSRCAHKHKSDFHIVCIISKEDLLKVHFLPFRKDQKPYLCLVHINLDKNPRLASLPFFRRKDVIFFSYDLGDHILKTDGKFILSGVTLPSPVEYEGEQRKISAANKYLISFKGNCQQHGWFDCCFVRKRLKQLSEEDNSGKYNYLYVDTSDDQVSRSKAEYMRILKDSTFCFVLHGDGRWSHRFVEVIGSGGIPVIIADELTLPFEQFINYDDACIKIPEQLINRASHINEILDLLPKDELTIVSMMEKIRIIHDTCFKSKLIRINMLLQAASYHHEVNRRNLRKLGSISPLQ